MRKISILSFLFFSFAILKAQEVDSSSIDSAVLSIADTLVDDTNKKTNWFNEGYPNPKKAAILGLAVPGGGQIYNKRWWKLPIVYGAVIGMGFTVDYNQSRYRRLRTALNQKRNGEAHEFEGTNIDSEASLKSLRDEFDKNTQIAYVGMFLVYALQAMEAFVDAHLKGFDVDEDISLKIRPEAGYIPALGTSTIGIGVSIPLYSKPYLRVDQAPLVVR
jgi:hypothetical protein